MLYEFIQFMNKRYRIPKRQSKMEHPEKLASFGYSRHRVQTNNIKHKTEH